MNTTFSTTSVMELLIPIVSLSNWRCDRCGQWIHSPADGILEWTRSCSNGPRWDYRIVHDAPACSVHVGMPWHESVQLTAVTGLANAQHLLSLLDRLPRFNRIPDLPRTSELGEWFEIYQRLQLPFYEEGRYRLQQAAEAGDVDDYQPAALFAPRFVERQTAT